MFFLCLALMVTKVVGLVVHTARYDNDRLLCLKIIDIDHLLVPYPHKYMKYISIKFDVLLNIRLLIFSYLLLLHSRYNLHVFYVTRQNFRDF